jgi:hypothetical protein
MIPFQLFDALIDASRTDELLRVTPALHFSLFPVIIEVFPDVGSENYAEALRLLSSLLKSREISAEMMLNLLPIVLLFLSVVQQYFISLDLNSPRVIQWTEENQKILVEHQSEILDNLLVLTRVLPENQVHDEDWGIANRDVTFRLVINWALTTDETLEQVKDQAMDAISAVAKVGPIFSDTLLFDSVVIRLLGYIERHGRSVLGFLLFYHPSLLLELYVEAYFCQPRKIANCFLEAIGVLAEPQWKVIQFSVGSLLLLVFVLKLRQNPLADWFMDFVLKRLLTNQSGQRSYQRISEKLKEGQHEIVLPKQFTYAAEAVFESGFRLAKCSLAIPICDSLMPWIRVIRLLPKQMHCVDDAVSRFHRFAPYQFLVRLMEMTAVVNEDQFDSIGSLWSDLVRCSDH